MAVDFGESRVMGSKKDRSTLLRSWIDASKKEQAEWIVNYLSKKNDGSALADYLMGRDSLVEAQSVSYTHLTLPTKRIV